MKDQYGREIDYLARAESCLLYTSLYTWTDILLFVDCLIHKEVFEKSIARDLSLLRYT